MSMIDELPGTDGSGAFPDEFAAALGRARGALDSVAGVPASRLGDAGLGERVADVLRTQAIVDELAARLVAEVEARELATDWGFSSARAWLMTSARLSQGAAAELVAQARACGRLPQTSRQAWAAGQLTEEQAIVAGRALDALDPTLAIDVVNAAEQRLLDCALEFGYNHFRHLANRLVEVVDPDAAERVIGEQLEAEEARARQQAVFRSRRGIDGIATFSGKIPNVHLDMLNATLDSLTSPRRGARPSCEQEGTDDAFDPSQALVAGPPEADPGSLSYGNRLGLALCELIEHLPADALPKHGAANATVVITVSEQALRDGLGEAMLDTGSTVSVSEARRLACNAGLIPMVLSGSSAVLDLGMAERLFSRYQRVALAVRDGGCSWPGCERPPAWCEAHHIEHWRSGGPTDLSNGCLLCGFHHRLLHSGDWSIAMAADGVPEVIPPARIDPQRVPLRHQRFRRRQQQSPLN